MRWITNKSQVAATAADGIVMRTHNDFTDEDANGVGQLATAMLNVAGPSAEPFVVLTALLAAHRHILKQLPTNLAHVAILGISAYNDHLLQEFATRIPANGAANTH
ncbi:hypothetical protein [Diaphorobacter caeni]|uniref:hypothetical protein n=1 Tax=Diaphorobacter caeni TaxID=2784387 RepID=UPI00188F14DA|nr:hypothetical protein [Diaphorobacter caeni]MBF5006373.1 hypothetical protein [Diaphorobacter caeni]